MVIDMKVIIEIVKKKEYFLYYYFFNIFILIAFIYIVNDLGIGDWGLGIGDWGLGIGPNPQSPFYISQI